MEGHDLYHVFHIQLTDYLGSKETYYRYKNGERLFYSEQQEWIVRLPQAMVTRKMLFDQYVETYNYKKIVLRTGKKVTTHGTFLRIIPCLQKNK